MKSKKIVIAVLVIVLLCTLGIYFFKASTESIPLNLTETEKTFIKEHPVITLAPDPNFAPVEFFDEKGNFKGIVSDYIKYINKNTDLNIQIVRYDTWEDIINVIAVKEVDMLGGVSKSPRRNEFLLFSKSYMDIPNVLVSSNDHIDITDETLPNFSIGVTKGSANHDLLKKYYPETNIILVENIQEGLEKVALGQLDLFSGSLGQITYYIDYYKYTNLNVIKEMEYSYPIHFAVRKDYEPLINILNKILITIPKETEETIQNKWIGLDPTRYFITKDFFLKLILTFIVILGISFLVIKVLKYEVNRRTREINELNTQLKDTLSDSRKMSHEIALSMINLVEIHDHYTKGHSQNVANYTKSVGEKLGLKAKALDQAYYSALLHDLGKALIPHGIISKKGQLTDEEYEEIKKHPFFGHKVLKNMESFEAIAKNILFHHERFDGKGYPKGIEREEIPIVSRIIAVTDAYDAMTTNRSYRKKMSRKEALVELRNNAGTQFDPVVVDIFVSIVDEIDIKRKDLSKNEEIAKL